jgi:C1A family cysteine protease
MKSYKKMKIPYHALYRFCMFVIRNGRSYDEPTFWERFSVFENNLAFIEETNRQNLSYRLALNSFADLTHHEFVSRYTGTRYPSHSATACDPPASGRRTTTGNPASLDWREKEVVTPVKDQGQCGSCWAFAVAETLESAYAITRGELAELSPQELVDCDTESYGCQGGYPELAMGYADAHGLEKEDEYPYTAVDGVCRGHDSPYRASGCFEVAPNDEAALEDAIQESPVVVLIEADQRAFQFYSSGILEARSCGQSLNHAVQLVGYGTEDGRDYWIVRNSWGAGWGEEGYIRLEKGAGGAGTCGLATAPLGFKV